MEEELYVDSYIGFKGNISNNLILIRKEKEIDKKYYKEQLKYIEEEEYLENEKKKKLKSVYNLKNIDINHNYYELKREELKYNFFMIYAIGTNIIKENILDNNRTIFKSDESEINKLYVDKNKKYICCCKESKLISNIYIYDFENKKKPIILSLHKFRTVDISISNDGKYLLSSGGHDDKYLILTQIENQKFIYKCLSDYPYTNISFFHKTNNFVIGDVLVVNIKSKVLEKIIPENYLFGNGLNVIKILDDNTIMTGSGDGYISLIDIEEKKVLRKTKLYGSINSIEMRNKSTLFISIYENIIYVMDLINNNHYVLLLIHNHYVNDLCFPFNYNYIMYTCSYNSVMAWQFYDKKAIYLKNIDKGKFIYYDKKFLNIPTEKRKKLCKLNLMHESKINNSLENKKKKNSLQNYEKINKNLICHSIKITNDGNYIALSIHNNIYLLTSKYMKIITVILNSHYDFCNVLIFYNKYDLITAGNNGDIKFWKFDKGKYLNVNTINYHSSIINQIILYADKYLCSCSEDGLITIYNIQESTLFKKIIDINNTRYKQISLNNQYDILLCCGNNNIFMYYDLIKYDISKNFYYSPFHNVLSLDIDKKGNYFITGSDDYKIRLYEFKSCTCLYIGVAHNNVIHKCLFTFDNMYIVSASKDESIKKIK
ncbi:hypothetical protein PFMALIP_04602 [Plasmodium falciparum MaliPS096_E11]|uniref:Cilia- and flagella-associated protein 52 n=1 Tax=Plasmodium falciparum MaliPS096_E11 TaxID=1036727 RepID=A0A024WKN2_PLAFA|nr:hypothetical protein PFMALIP_04602 [Plasmodium falciparum MaliPS096_E11]